MEGWNGRRHRMDGWRDGMEWKKGCNGNRDGIERKRD